MKKALLTVSVGTADARRLNEGIRPVEAVFERIFSDCDCFRAFSSEAIVRKIRSQNAVAAAENEGAPAVMLTGEALQFLQEKGYGHIYMMPTHLFDGAEFGQLMESAADFLIKNPHMTIQAGEPLIKNTEDCRAVACALDRWLPLQKNGEAIVWMGHGMSANLRKNSCGDENGSGKTVSDHGSPEEGLRNALQRQNSRYFYVTGARTAKQQQELLLGLGASGIRKVCLLPLMLTVGVHAQREMAGGQADSWKSILEKSGLSVETVMKSVGQCPYILQLYENKAKRLKACDDVHG